ncbi:hypothetical protein F8B77_02920 [Aliivibrio finisterrensis]|uniref:Uncharacterized protein n=1 Tax=Aliivibrio finisterrensis TaxID=511998 RepID=A0A6N6RXB9_9GAMM|nr:hypothetical protein F8B77_02920 [Aliivibrio finisterrensis]
MTSQEKKLKNFNQYSENGDIPSAVEYAMNYSGYNSKTRQSEHLLWSLQAGSVLQREGQFELSTQLLDSAEVQMRREDTENTLAKSGELVGSIATNDAMLDYEAMHYDGVMANTIKAWNFISLGDYKNARVELNRAEERQRRASEYFSNEIIEQKNQLASSGDIGQFVKRTINSKDMKYALEDAGIFTGQWQHYNGYVNPFTTYSYGLNLLLVAKDRSDYNNAANAFQRVYQLTGSESVKKDYLLAKSLSKKRSASLSNNIWVIVENGQTLTKEEKRLDIPMFLFSDSISYVGVALPRLNKRGLAFSNIKINGKSTELLSDMDKVVAAEFDKKFPQILTRELIRMTVKTAGQKLLDQESDWLGGAGAAYTIATTGADVRSFTALPSQYQIARLTKKSNEVVVQAGQYRIPVQLDKQSGNHIIWVSATSKYVTPKVKVFNI